VYRERIPGFAICGRCGVRDGLRACSRCGLLTCRTCRGEETDRTWLATGEVDFECAVCTSERLAELVRVARRRRWRRIGHQMGVFACAASIGLAAVGAALLPDPQPPPLDEHDQVVARGQVRFVSDAIERWSDAHRARCPASLDALRQEGFLVAPAVDPWDEPLLYGCVESPRTFVVVSKGPDRRAGTADDIVFSVP
jgi:hypothetical protein